jgi:hypothetical protein
VIPRFDLFRRHRRPDGRAINKHCFRRRHFSRHTAGALQPVREHSARLTFGSLRSVHVRVNSTMKAKYSKSSPPHADPLNTLPDRDKLELYQALCDLNRGFEDVSAALDRLARIAWLRKRLPREFLTAWRLTIAEARAWANFEVVEILRDYEEEVWARFGQLRHWLEKANEEKADRAIKKHRG